MYLFIYCAVLLFVCSVLCSDSGGGNGVSERVVNQLLTELDGLEARKDVYIIAATNRLELIDDAMLRPGRLGKLLYVPLPGPEDRVSILNALIRKVSVNTREGDSDRVKVECIANDRRTQGFSGADLSALVREAGLAVVKEWRQKDNIIAAAAAASGSNNNVNMVMNSEQHHMSTVTTTMSSVNDQEQSQQQHYISMRHFEVALNTVRPSVSTEDKLRYDKVYEFLQGGMSAIQALKAASKLYPS